MLFIDEVNVVVRAGNGGNGCAAMRREKFVPLGGPAGGDGGRGGDVVFVGDERLTTLLDLHYRRTLEAERGEHGRGKDQYGKGGEDLRVRVPVGTQVFDAETGALVGDVDGHGKELLVAKGGKGGRGNKHFATPYDRAPTHAEPGGIGEERKLRLELKMLADVGIVGFPNVGKSTFISRVSRARPKIADYPFTTLVPNLGVVSRGEERSFVVADIPGIIEGASEGAGLGIRFLKHIERTRILLHVVALDPGEGRSPTADFDTLCRELERFDAALAGRPTLVVMGKMDLPEAKKAFPAFKKAMQRRGHVALAMSAATGEGVDKVLDALETLLKEHPNVPTPRAVPLPPRRRRGTQEQEELLRGNAASDDADDAEENADGDDGAASVDASD